MAARGLADYDVAYNAARDAAQNAVEVAPDYSGGYYQLSWIEQWYDDDLQAAIEYMSRALEIESSDPAMLGNSAVLLMHIGRLDDSIALQEYSAERSLLEPSAFYNLGLAYAYADRLDDAERSFRKAVQLSPEYSHAHAQLGLVLLLQNRPEEALDMFGREVDDAGVVKGSALANFALGRTEAANAALQELIEKLG